MIDDGSPPAETSVSFGPFRLVAAERLLEKSGKPVQLGGRALDILVVLIERAGEVVSKKELMSRVWPNVTVDESSLRVHVAGLRKALGDGQAGARYVANVPGRGYCFVAPISLERDPPPEPAKAGSTKPALALPDKPSIAVLAFQNMSGDPEQDISPTGWSRRSSPHSAAFAGCS